MLGGLGTQKTYGIHEEVPLSGEDPEAVVKLPEMTVEKLLGKIAFPDPNKWLGYGVNPPIDTEVKGTVIGKEPGNGFIYLMPDQNYKHLLIPGNWIAPQPGPPPDTDYDWWNINLKTNYIRLNLPFNGIIPVIKMEPSDSYPSLNRNYGHDEGYIPHYKETDLYKPGKPVQIGDRLSVTGLYVLELQHTMYGDCRPPFVNFYTMFRYGGPSCYGHAEIHPYNISSITSLPDDVKPHDVVKESHTFGFPVYFLVFHTNVFNNLNELKGRLPDEGRYREINKVLFIKAPPKPVECNFVDDINCRITVNEN